MESLLASITPHAVAVALSPMPIAALIFLLLSDKAKVNSIIFAFGWTVGVILNVIVFSFIFNQQQYIAAGSKSTVAALIDGALGLFLLYVAFKQWKKRPKPGETPQVPKWMQSIESISPLKACILALTLITINAKNTVLDIATAVTIGQNASNTSEMITATIYYGLVASCTIIIPVIAFLFLGKKLDTQLQNAKQWFVYNSATILFVLFLILGVELLAKAFK